QMHSPVALDEVLEVVERIARREPQRVPGVGRLPDGYLGPPRLEDQEGLGPQKAVPADLLAPDHALKEERRRRALDAPAGGDGRARGGKAETGGRPSPLSWRYRGTQGACSVQRRKSSNEGR